MSRLAIDTLKKALKRIEDIQEQNVNSISYHENELFEVRTRIAAVTEEITGLKATIALLEKV